MSPKFAARVSRNVLEHIDLMVCDMAGTTVSEGGLVYQILEQCIRDGGLDVTTEEMHAWRERAASKTLRSRHK